MNSLTKLVACKGLSKFIGLATICVQATLITTALSAQESTRPLDTEIKHIDTAEAKSVSHTEGFSPERQPEVYWHDDDWRIDVIPPATLNEPYSLRIRSDKESVRIVKLPELYSQIDSIYLAPKNRAIVLADLNGMTKAFGIIDLDQGKIIDDVTIYSPSISPDRRFILFNDWYPPHAESYENIYKICDTLKTPRENTCGYRDNDPQHRDIDDGYRGFQIFPQKKGQILCTEAEDDDDNNMAASTFIWSTDSSKAVFADARDGIMSLVLVTMPKSTRDNPRTSIYPLVGEENVCAGATYCDYGNVSSIAFDGDSVKAALMIRPNPGKPVEKDLTIPLWKFVPIGK